MCLEQRARLLPVVLVLATLPAMLAGRLSADQIPEAPSDPHSELSEPSTSDNPIAGVEAAGEVPASTADADCELVTVFYGTDRNALEHAPLQQSVYLTWLYRTVACVGVTLLLALVALKKRWKLAALLAVLGALATLALGGVTYVARQQPTPAEPGPRRSYGNQRGVLEVGVCQVSIPKGHRLGKVERPSLVQFNPSTTRNEGASKTESTVPVHLEFHEDATKHVVLRDVVVQDHGEFYDHLRRRVETAPGQEVFVFIHGYNVRFEDAARRTAQLAYDLGFQGAPIFFSWPSQGGLTQYSVDETNVVWAVPHLKEFLTSVARQSGAQSVHLIAHSMGNRALTSALELLSYELAEGEPPFSELVLTAPDIDADVFKRDIAPRIVKTAKRVTLYASSNDEALAFSKKVHGYPRAGDSGPGLIVVPGIETIDVSSVDTSLLGHSYYGSNQTVLADLIVLLHESKPPKLRPWLDPRWLDQSPYWVFVAKGPSGSGEKGFQPGRIARTIQEKVSDSLPWNPQR
jgi:esterase/lipase superfamily enzyme